MPLPGFSAAVRKAQEVERFRFAVAAISPIWLRRAAKLDDSRFVGMQLKPEPRKSLAQALALSVSWPAQRSLTLRPTDSPSRLTRPSTPEAPTALLSPRP
jgi:hypothetical protein